jgi:hypothetical protein
LLTCGLPTSSRPLAHRQTDSVRVIRRGSEKPKPSNFVATDKRFQIRFGTKDGERRAYFTETASATICDIAVSGGHLLISPTTVPVPGGG